MRIWVVIFFLACPVVGLAQSSAFSLHDEAFLATVGHRNGYVGRTFNGVSTNVLNLSPTPVATILEGASAITVVARVWLDPLGTNTARQIFGAQVGNGTLSGLGLTITTAGKIEGSGRSQTGDSFQSKVGATTVPFSEWHTVAAINDIAGDTINVYYDGVLDTSGSAAVTFGATSFTGGTSYTASDRIGNNTTAVQPYYGKLADVAVFARALTTAELLAITAGTRPSSLASGSPALYYPMDKFTDRDGRFAHSDFGGLDGVIAGDVPSNTASGPTVLMHPPATPESRFPTTRVWRLKGSDASSVGSGNAITSVNVRNAGISASQSSAGNRPTYQSISGLDAIRFTASGSQYLTMPGIIDMRRGITIVSLMDIRWDGRVVSISSSATTDAANAFVFSAVVGLAVHGSASAGFSTYTDYTTNSTGVALFSGKFSGNAVKNWLNGVARNGTVTAGTELSDGSFLPTSLPNANTTQLGQIGRRLSSGSNLYLDGDLYDIIIVNGALTDEEVQFLEGVIAWDNNQTALLPASHPWKTIRPTKNSQINYPWGFSVVNRSDAPATSFLGSPSLVAANNKLYATHDYFDSTGLGTTGRLYVSSDNGRSWQGLCAFSNYLWGTIWQHTDGNLYVLATTRGWGDLQIGKSTDGGALWSWTTLSASGGPVAAAGAGTTPPNYHRAGGLPPLYHDGYLFLAVENLDPFSYASGMKSFVLYAQASADLMNKANWNATSQLAVGANDYAATAGFIEGNVVIDDAAQMWNALRWQSSGAVNVAVFLPLTWSNPTLSMPTWSTNYIKSFLGGNVKFQLADGGSTFYSLVNENTSPSDTDQRNRVSLISGSAADLTSPSFSRALVVIDPSTLATYTGMSAANSISYHGFQYMGFDIYGSFSMAIYRISWSGANTYHNSNFIGFGHVAIP